MKVLIIFQTYLLLLLPLQSTGFNISFSGAGVGKCIKENKLWEKDYHIKTIVIDPGHGGHDPGCLGSSSQEKHIALAVGKKLAHLISQRYPSINVIMTRESDVFIPLYERAAIANRNGADLFISVHCNFMPGRADIVGTETYVMGLHTAEHNLKVAKRENASILLEDDYRKNYDYDPNSPEGHIMLSMYQNAYLEQSILFAEKVESSFKNQAMRKSRGVKQAGFVVLKETAMPSVLVETGFLSNLKEETFFKTTQGQLTAAKAIFEAFAQYKELVESSDYITLKASPKAVYFQPDQSAQVERKLQNTPGGTTEKRQSKFVPIVKENPARPPVEVQAEPKIIPLRYSTSEGITTKEGNAGNKFVIVNTQTDFSTYPASHETMESIRFHVQLAASPKPIDTGQNRWKNIGYQVEVLQEDHLFKYQARNFFNLQQAFQAKILLQSKGFPDAFIVSYKNGKRIPMDQAKRELGIQ